ncbi:MAG TPA: gamma-glutamylcyclotransferase family protein [Phycisphaerae bacterium]|nr:gamma-glutamylcyclotransferase family protein [Phycisphaerae bacterium]
MARQKPFNLFVYGTLLNPSVFRAVLGRPVLRDGDPAGDGFLARDAILHGYKKISPDHTYLYAVPDPHGRIRGRLIGPLPPELMDALRHYEGRNYRRRTVRVVTTDGPERAVAFVANLEQLRYSFGYEFHDPFKQEILLREKIDAALLETEKEQLHTDEKITRRAVGELHGDTIRDLVRIHFDGGGISDYAIRHSLKDAPLRDFSRVASDPEARALAPNYLAMVVRQVLFNQIEERIREDFRYELDHMDQAEGCYERTISSLAALRILNADPALLDALVADCLAALRFPTDHLVDFVQWAVAAADSVYDSGLARQHMDYIRNHRGRGYIPLGAELEFSNIGHNVIADPDGRQVRDPRYDGFLYFSDFGLDALTWKLGGHIDDHREKVPGRPRRGFFEVALGSLSIRANLSKPITNDPWLLNQFVHEARRFYEIAPHSVHLSLQLRTRHRTVSGRTMPLYVLQCLFAIAGDAVRDESGRVRIRRLVTDEIITRGAAPNMLFSEVRKRYSSESDEFSPQPRAGPQEGRYVQQFRFLRLSPHLNYEPIVMGLKGLQVALSPGSFLNPSQYETSPRHRRLFDRLLAWGESPAPVGQRHIEAFLRHVHRGLMSERRGRPAHSEAYIAWSLARLRRMLLDFNALFDAAPPAGRSGAGEGG